MSIKCPGCKAENKDGAKFCKECGYSFSSLITCPSCSALIKPGKFCASCGHNFSAPLPETEVKPVLETLKTNPLEQMLAAPEPAILVGGLQTIAPEPTPEPASESLVAQKEAAPQEPPPVLPTTEVLVPTKPHADAIPLQKIEPNAAENNSAERPKPPVPGGGFKAAYALIAIALVIVGGGIYWWMANTTKTEIPQPAATPVSPSVMPAVVAPLTPASAPTESPSAPVAPVAHLPEPVSAPAQAPVATATPAAPPAVKAVPVAPVKPKEPKQEPQKMPASSSQPDSTEKGKGVTHAPAVSPKVAVPAETTKREAPAKTVDELYNERITAECSQGFFPGFACREKIRWEVCQGKWSPDSLPGQTTCNGAGNKSNPG